MLGRFHEISLQTTDIRESVEFYERLGFTQASTNDTWTHPYGVLTDGRAFIGLHQRRFAAPALTFVHASVAQFANDAGSARHRARDAPARAKTSFNEIGFRDPDGQSVLRARGAHLSRPSRAAPDETSLLRLLHRISACRRGISSGAREFWEPMGFVATEEPDAPYAHMPLTSDHLDIAFHRPRTLDRPMLVFRDPNMRERLCTHPRAGGEGDRRAAARIAACGQRPDRGAGRNGPAAARRRELTHNRRPTRRAAHAGATSTTGPRNALSSSYPIISAFVTLRRAAAAHADEGMWTFHNPPTPAHHAEVRRERHAGMAGARAARRRCACPTARRRSFRRTA